MYTKRLFSTKVSVSCTQNVQLQMRSAEVVVPCTQNIHFQKLGSDRSLWSAYGCLSGAHGAPMAFHGRPMAPPRRPCGAHGSPWTPMGGPMGGPWGPTEGRAGGKREFVYSRHPKPGRVWKGRSGGPGLGQLLRPTCLSYPSKMTLLFLCTGTGVESPTLQNPCAHRAF